MTVTEAAAFWTWYNTGLRKGGKRSFKEAAEILGKSAETLRRWARDGDWEKAAAAKDAEVISSIEDMVTKEILEDTAQIIKRQRSLIALIYRRIMAGLENLTPTFDQMLELMKYEAQLGITTGGPGAGTGASLFLLMQNLSPEVRSDIHRANGELRRGGRFDMVGPGVRPVSGN